MSPHRHLTAEDISKLMAEREDSYGRGDIKRFLELTAQLGMEIEPEFEDRVQIYQADLMTNPSRESIHVPALKLEKPESQEKNIDYPTLLKLEGINFGMGTQHTKKYLNHFSLNELKQIWDGMNQIVLRPELHILYPAGSIILPFAASIVKRSGDPKYSHLYAAKDPYELVNGLDNIAFRFKSIDDMHNEYRKNNADKPLLILKPHDLEWRIKNLLPSEAGERLISSFQEEYDRSIWRPTDGCLKKEIILHLERSYEQAKKKYLDIKAP